MITKSNNFLIYTTLLIVILFIAISLAQTLTRYNLNQQIAISDRIIGVNEKVYPSNEFKKNKEATVSQYFPGTAFFISPINYLISSDKIKNYIYASLAVITHLLFILILAKIHCGLSKSKLFFSFFSILIFSMLITKSYTFYSLEFKPDTIAFTIGLWALYFFDKAKNENSFKVTKIVLSGIFFGLGIAFKQQYISFIGGILLFNFISLNKNLLIFTLSLLIILFFVLINFNNFEFFWFWNLETFKDDGFMSLNKYLYTNKFLFFNFFLFSFIFLNISYEKIDKEKIIFFSKKIIYLIKNQYTWVLLPASLSCFLSGYKVGGNISNTGLGMLLLFPVFFSIVSEIKMKWLKIFLIFGILNIAPFAIKSLQNYKYFYDLSDDFKKIEIKNNDILLYGSTFYTIVKNKKNISLNDYWTEAQRNGIDLNISFINALETLNPKYILVESFLKDEFSNISLVDYEIILENKVGILAKKN